jgi:hypothetical protein
MDDSTPIGLSIGSQCCLCGKNIGGHSAANPYDYEAVFVSRSGRIYCGECASKMRVNIFHSLSRLGRNKEVK